MAERKCTTEIMADDSDFGVGVATGTVGRRPWESYAPACSGADDNDNTTMDWGAILKNATPLHFAAMTNENLAVLQALLAAGANPDAKGSNDRTPLHYAALRKDNAAVLQFLLAAGADINARTSEGETPLDVATRKENWSAVQTLQDNGASQ